MIGPVVPCLNQHPVEACRHPAAGRGFWCTINGWLVQIAVADSVALLLFVLALAMDSIQSIRDSFDAAQAIGDKVLAQKQMEDLLQRISPSYTAVGGKDVVMQELDGNMQTISSLLSKAAGWEQALDAVMLESEILLLKSQFHSDVGEWAAAVESLEHAILIAQKLGDEFAHAKALRQWGLMSLMQQQPARAEELFKRSSHLFRRYSTATLCRAR
jgi:hypothetical protein